MADLTQDQQSAARAVCAECLAEQVLAEQVRADGKGGTCSYCGEQTRVVSTGDVARRIDEVFRENFAPGDIEPVFTSDDKDDSWQFEQAGRSLPQVLNEMIGAEPFVCKALADALVEDEVYSPGDGEDSFYEHDVSYQFIDPTSREHRLGWQYFTTTVMHERRFFGSRFRGELDEILSGLDQMDTEGEQPPLRTIGNGEQILIYRGRKATSADARIEILSDPERHLGAPPPKLARAGRLSPAGIPLFYGALDEPTALAELRMAVGESAIAGAFLLTRPLRVLDLAALERVFKRLSYFQPDFRSEVSRLAFLRTFGSIISRAVGPTDAELEYIPTQVFAEYVLYEWKDRVDAIIYASSQGGEDRKNIAIRADLAGVAAVERPSLREGPIRPAEWFGEDQVHYSRPVKTSMRMGPALVAMEYSPATACAEREITLSLDPLSIRVHNAESVHTDCRSWSVDLSDLQEKG